MNIKPSMVAALVLFAFSSHVKAVPFLFDWAYNVDGTLSENLAGDSMPVTGALDANGLGDLTMNISGAGDHSIVAFFDFEIDQPTNTFFNEYGATGGTLAAGQSWEIDEPGYVFGDIYDNVLAGSLDNSNGVPDTAVDDVSFALGWNFSLAADQTALITFSLADVLDTAGFYLSHVDPEAGPSFDQVSSVYFWSELEIIGDTRVPEPPVAILLAVGLAGLSFARRAKRKAAQGIPT